MDASAKQNNFLVTLVLIPFSILRYSVVGVKSIFGGKNANIAVIDGKEVDKNALDDYERNKIKKNQKKKKQYTYSNRVLKKLEEEKAILTEDLKQNGAIRNETPVLYFFKVRDKNGKIITGTMTGVSKLDINAFLLNEEYDVYVIKSGKMVDILYKDAGGFGSAKMSKSDLAFFLAQLATYLKAGLTLANSLRILGKQMSKNKAKSRVMQALSFELSLGEDFSAALEKQGNMFPQLLINMIRAAEASGTLIETLEDMNEYYTDLHTTRKQIISAITYPAVILTFSALVITFIMLYVIPQFTEIYASNGSEITGITAIVINVSDFIRANVLNMVLILIISIISIVVLYKNVKAVRTSVQVFLMNTPIIKNVIIYSELTIFSKTFASLLKNNVYITDSVDILSKITTNEVYKSILFETINNVIRGDNISEAFEGHWAVPEVAYYMIVTGESTGELASMMDKVAVHYQEIHKTTVTSLKTMIEPVLTAVLALIVGLILVAIIVPMYESMQNWM